MAVTVGFCFALGKTCFAAFLLGDTEPSPRRGRDWTLWAGGGCLLLGAEQAVVIGNLGPELARRLNSPFFALAKSVGVEGAFQRVEGVITALWTFADLTMAGVLVFAARSIGQELFPGKWRPWIPWCFVFVAAAGAITVLSGAGRGEYLSRTLVPVGNIILGAVIPCGLYLIQLARRKGKDRGISCDKRSK